MITFKQKGDFSKTESFLKKPIRSIQMKYLEKYADDAITALESATPKDTGLTAGSWYYKIINQKDCATIQFCNSNIQNGVPIAVILQNGHATKNGGWVEGIDYIDPALRPIFEKIAKQAWEEVSKS